MDHAAYCSAAADEIACYADLIDGADLTTPVPSCPGWDLLTLTKHLGTVHRWSLQMLRDNATERLDFRQVDRNLPTDPSGYAAWLRAGGEALVSQLRAHAASDAVWSWGAAGTAGWWARRMTHETLVHRADAALALGAEFNASPERAVDGLDEFLENLPAAAASFAPQAAAISGNGETVHLHATDADGEWMITLTPDGFTWTHGHDKGNVAARGTAIDMLLLAYGRLAPDSDRLQRFGDTDLLTRWQTMSAI